MVETGRSGRARNGRTCLRRTRRQGCTHRGASLRRTVGIELPRLQEVALDHPSRLSSSPESETSCRTDGQESTITNPDTAPQRGTQAATATGAGNECVEIAGSAAGSATIHDSKDPDGELCLSSWTWAAFRARLCRELATPRRSGHARHTRRARIAPGQSRAPRLFFFACSRSAARRSLRVLPLVEFPGLSPFEPCFSAFPRDSTPPPSAGPEYVIAG